MLYLENTLATHAFTPDRVAVLELLAAQAAISLENTLLYRDLQEREARIRRLVDSNIIGILFWDAGGDISYANDAFLSMTGYSRQELVSGTVRWKDMTPVEYHSEDAQRLEHLRLWRQIAPREKEFFRKDGSRVPVLIGSVLLAGSSDESISFVLDLTERKQAEAEARESERRYQKMQIELAHANRVATMGQLTSSIAHEVAQPIGAIAINAGAALRWLGRKAPDIEEARISIEQIAEDAHRSGEVIGRIRELFQKAPPRKGHLDLNEVVREVIVLTHSEALKTGVSVKTQFADGLSLIAGDRVQLQQVVLNLVVNAIQAMATVADGVRDLLITTARTEANFVLVRVADSGPGLDPQTLEHVFDPYYTTKPDGLGMGLAICHSIIDAHNGRLWAAPTSPAGPSFSSRCRLTGRRTLASLGYASTLKAADEFVGCRSKLASVNVLFYAWWVLRPQRFIVRHRRPFSGPGLLSRIGCCSQSAIRPGLATEFAFQFPDKWITFHDAGFKRARSRPASMVPCCSGAGFTRSGASLVFVA